MQQSHTPETSPEPVIVNGFEKGVPPLWFCQMFLIVGGVCILLTATGGEAIWRQTENGAFALGELFFGGMLMGFGSYWLRARNQILQHLPSSELALRLGLEEESFLQLADERGVMPRFIVNGVGMYAPEDFTEATTLLRASSHPSTSAYGELLRPAGVAQTPSELLLRPGDLPLATQLRLSQPTRRELFKRVAVNPMTKTFFSQPPISTPHETQQAGAPCGD